MGFIYLFIYPPSNVEVPTLRFHSEIPTLPTDPLMRGFPCVWKLLFYDSLVGWVSIPNSFVSLFNLLYFVLPPFEDNGLPIWVPGVLCQRSEFVLWNLLSVQVFFR